MPTPCTYRSIKSIDSLHEETTGKETTGKMSEDPLANTKGVVNVSSRREWDKEVSNLHTCATRSSYAQRQTVHNILVPLTLNP